MSDSIAGLTRREALKRGITVGGAAMVWAVPTTQAFGMTSTVASETSGLLRGCTPGFWKNHPDAWQGTPYSPADKLWSTFGIPPADGWCGDYLELANFLSGHPDLTLQDALEFTGSYGDEAADTLSGALRILLRAATAFLLNVATFYAGIGESTVETDVIGPVLVVLSEGCDMPDEEKRAEILALASQFDAYNNRRCDWSQGEGEFLA